MTPLGHRCDSGRCAAPRFNGISITNLLLYQTHQHPFGKDHIALVVFTCNQRLRISGEQREQTKLPKYSGLTSAELATISYETSKRQKIVMFHLPEEKDIHGGWREC